jgi:biopolymer transport protein ExbB
MNFDLKHIWHEMGLPSKVVALALVIMALMSLGVLLERIVFLIRAGAESRAFALKARALMKTSDLVGLTKAAVAHRKSPLATLLHGGALKYLEYCETEDENNLGSIEAARREMTRKAEVVSADLRRGMSILASVGSLAPFVGLLGTVLGILSAFGKIGATGSAGLSTVASGIAEALIETAFGLFVAIPSVAFFNYLSGKVDGLERDLTHATGEFLDELERNHAPPRVGEAEKPARHAA